jgi:arylsulfatase A-like enzyme
MIENIISLSLLNSVLFLFFSSMSSVIQVHIVIDDLGWSDVSWRQEQGAHHIQTPKMNELKEQGILLNQFYTPKDCAPSRASMMTGRWPFRVGYYGNPGSLYVKCDSLLECVDKLYYCLVFVFLCCLGYTGSGDDGGVPENFEFLPQMLYRRYGFQCHHVRYNTCLP